MILVHDYDLLLGAWLGLESEGVCRCVAALPAQGMGFYDRCGCTCLGGILGIESTVLIYMLFPKGSLL